MPDWPFDRNDLTRGAWRHGWQDFSAGRGKFWVTAVAAIVGAFLGGAVSPTASATAPEKGGLLVAGVSIGIIIGLSLSFFWHLVRASFRQRDGLKIQVVSLEAEIARRDAVLFSIEESFENDGVPVPADGGQQYANRTVLWIAVENHGSEAEFSARFLNLQGVRQLQKKWNTDRYQGSVAWESTPEKRTHIGFCERERLVAIATFTDPPNTLWFNVPYAEYWGGPLVPHGIHKGWTLERLGNTVEFDITVIDVTHSQAIERHATVTFNEAGGVQSFVLDEHLGNT